MALLLPTAYLPPISYMGACIAADQILIEAWETYPKQTIRNRCEILGPNGRQILTIPVSKPHGNRTRTKDIRVAGHLRWQQIHWRSLETAYNKSPFFIYYQDRFRPFYEQEYTWLLDLNLRLLEILFQTLRIDTPVALTESFRNQPEGDGIDVIARSRSCDPEFSGEAGATKQRDRGSMSLRGAEAAIPSSREKQDRRSNGIREYYQVFADRHGFQKDLSVVDLIFNLGPDAHGFFL